MCWLMYFGAVGIQRARHAVACVLLAKFAGVAAAIRVCYWFLGRCADLPEDASYWQTILITAIGQFQSLTSGRFPACQLHKVSDSNDRLSL